MLAVVEVRRRLLVGWPVVVGGDFDSREGGYTEPS